tara:strand:- start:12 stop:221 length:210 start_codon:yes stop_codon:yes gene_type:complete
MLEYNIWLLLVSIIFTFVGYYMGKKDAIGEATNSAVDLLIAEGYLRYKKLKNGEIEIIKWNEINDRNNS